MNETLEKIFHLEARGSSVRTEITAGVTTFMTMAYILAVNPSILSTTGMDAGAVFAATVIGACLGTLLMAFLSNYPFVLAPGMGLNAFFAFTIVGQMGYSWQIALAAVFAEGVLFIVLSLTGVREAIFNSMPMSLKYGVTSGIGLFIAFIGLQNANLVVAGPKLVGLYPFRAALADGSFHTVGIGALLALLGTFFTAALMARRTPGGILWGILATWLAGVACEMTGVYVPNSALGMFSVMPRFADGFGLPSLAPTFMQMDFSMAFTLDFITIMITFIFVDLFDTLGTLIGVAARANMLDENGYLPNIRGALLADSIATVAGAVLGTSTVTTFVESSAGVGVGGRTGLTALVSAALFALSLFLAPVFLAIPAFATAPALIIVGFLMLGSLLRIDFDDAAEAVPAYIAVIAMPFMYSISEGIAMGIIAYVVIHLLAGAAHAKKISPIVYILAALFVLKYIFV